MISRAGSPRQSFSAHRKAASRSSKASITQTVSPQPPSQDLEAAFQKLGKMRMAKADKIEFTQNGQLTLVPSQEAYHLAFLY